VLLQHTYSTKYLLQNLYLGLKALIMSYARTLIDSLIELIVHFARTAARIEAQISPVPAPLRWFSKETKVHHLQLEGLSLVSFVFRIFLLLPSLDRFLPRPLRRYKTGDTRAQYLRNLVRAFIIDWTTVVFVRAVLTCPLPLR
jgi:hypothetical protein